jgi:hypothetical protein
MGRFPQMVHCRPSLPSGFGALRTTGNLYYPLAPPRNPALGEQVAKFAGRFRWRVAASRKPGTPTRGDRQAAYRARRQAGPPSPPKDLTELLARLTRREQARYLDMSLRQSYYPQVLRLIPLTQVRLYVVGASDPAWAVLLRGLSRFVTQ